MRRLIPVLVVCLLGACAANTGVVSMGQGTYLIEEQAATGFTGLGNMKAEAIAEAGAFCAQQGGNFQVVDLPPEVPSL